MPRLTQPRADEPIRIISTGAGPRYEAIVTTSAPGAAKRHQSRRRFATLKGARAWVDRTRTEVSGGDFTGRDTVTLSQLVDRWAAAKDNVRTISRDTYLAMLKPILRDHGSRRVQQISRAEIDAWRSTWPTEGGMRRDGLSRRSIEMMIRALRMVFDYAIDNGIIKTNPAAKVIPPRDTLAQQQQAARRKVTATVWDFAGLRRFVAEADKHNGTNGTVDLAAAMRLSACGLRRSEVLGLAWSAVNLETGTVSVEQGRARHDIDEVKSKASNRVVNVEQMMPGTVAALKALKARQAAQRLANRPGGWMSDLVVVNAIGAPYDRDVYSTQFRRIAKAAGLPRVRLHSLRHTIASELHARGVPPATVAAMLGHTLGVHLTTYVRSMPTGDDAAAAAFAAAFAGSRLMPRDVTPDVTDG
ncbi:MAG: site-specific integrase [Microlunatus sp.]|nr:site-specific integrase [Microlunatus sp.]